jgi:hypothetical protein
VVIAAPTKESGTEIISIIRIDIEKGIEVRKKYQPGSVRRRVGTI